MSLSNMVHSIKELFPDFIILLKVGTFVDSYNDDASIMSYLFKYKLKTLGSLNTTCGFPTSSINHITGVLESKNINYLVVDKKIGY